MRRAALGFAFAAAAGCRATVPPTDYYSLAPPPAAAAARGTNAVVAIDALDADPPYDDPRIAYRIGPVQLDYYNYQRWAAPPGALIADYLADAFAASGRFGAVVRDGGSSAALTLGGRVLALEEVDVTPTRWVGRLAVELDATDPESGQLRWSERFDDTEPVAIRSPAGLARAITIAAQRIAARAIDRVAHLIAAAPHASAPAAIVPPR